MVKTIDATFLTLKMLHSSVLYDSVKTTCLAKIRFFIHGLKRSQPIRLQHSLIVNILVFLHEVSHQVKLVSETTTQGFPNSIREEWEILLGREFFVRWWESDKE